MIDGLAITITIGKTEVAGWLPLLPDRFLLESAYRRALGYREGDEAVASGKTSEPDFASTLCAAIGLCWGGEPLELILYGAEGPSVVLAPPGPRALRRFDRDVVAFGDAVCDALLRQGFEVSALYDAGRDVRQLMLDSIPTQPEVDAAEDFTEAPAGDSTAPTSS